MAAISYWPLASKYYASSVVIIKNGELASDEFALGSYLGHVDIHHNRAFLGLCPKTHKLLKNVTARKRTKKIFHSHKIKVFELPFYKKATKLNSNDFPLSTKA